MDNNPFRNKAPDLNKGHTPSPQGGGAPSYKKPSNSNFESMPNDDNEQAFKVPGFANANDKEKNGIANRLNQAEQAAKEIGGAVSGKRVAPRPKKEEDPLTDAQRAKVDTAKIAAKGARAIAGDERALAEMAEHPLETAKELKGASKFIIKTLILGCILVVLGISLVIIFLSNFSQQHVSQVIKDATFSPVDVSGARRVAQIFSSTLFGNGEDSFDVVKVLTNLQEEKRVKFEKNGQEIALEEFVSSQQVGGGGVTMVVGSRRLAVPANITQSTSPETIKFIKDLEISIKSSNLFAHEARIFRSPSAKQVYKQFGINLFRWEKKAEDIKTYSDNMKSLYDQVKDLEQTSLNLSDVDDSGKELDSVTTELLGKELPRSQKSVAIKTADIAWDKVTGEESLAAYSKKATTTEFVITSYCTAKSYIKNYEKIVTQKFVNSQRAALKLLSSDDQTMVGEVNPRAVSAEAQQMEFFETARPYLKAINADVTNTRPTLNEGQLAYQDPRLIKEIMKEIINVIERPLSEDGVVSAITEILFPDTGGGGWSWNPVDNFKKVVGEVADFTKDNFLKVIGWAPDQMLGWIADKLYPIICSKLTDLPNNGLIADILNAMGTPFQAALLQNVKEVLEKYKAYELRDQLGLKENVTLFSQPTENFMKFMYRTQKTIEYAGLDDGAELVSKDFEGVSALGNELSRIGGGRALDLDDQLSFTQQRDERNYAVLKEKPMAYRLFSLQNQYSPTSIIAARSPKSFGGATRRTQTQFASIFSPVNSYGSSANKAVAAAMGNKAVAQALSTDENIDRTVMFGYSVDELTKMHEDISFWPVQNREFVENNLDALEEKYGMCFDPKNSIKILHDEDINMWYGDCSPENLKGDDALHYRLYLLDNLHENSLTDLENVTQNTLIGEDTGPIPGTGDVENIKNLAQQLLDNPNVTYPYTDSMGVNVRQVLEGVAKTGKGLVNSPDVDFDEVAVSERMLQALVEYAKTNKIGLNALTNADHSSNSNHYKGIAVDIACTPALNRSVFETIAAKYGGTNNGEVCPDDRHWHYDFR